MKIRLAEVELFHADGRTDVSITKLIAIAVGKIPLFVERIGPL
jgi:hypothetical protein